MGDYAWLKEMSENAEVYTEPKHILTLDQQYKLIEYLKDQKEQQVRIASVQLIYATMLHRAHRTTARWEHCQLLYIAWKDLLADSEEIREFFKEHFKDFYAEAEQMFLYKRPVPLVDGVDFKDWMAHNEYITAEEMLKPFA